MYFVMLCVKPFPINKLTKHNHLFALKCNVNCVEILKGLNYRNFCSSDPHSEEKLHSVSTRTHLFTK